MCCVLIQNTLYVSLSTQEYNWVAELSQGSLVKCRGGGRGGVTMGWTGILSGGRVVILLVASCKETRIISSGPGRAIAQTQTLPNYLQPLDLDDMNCCY